MEEQPVHLFPVDWNAIDIEYNGETRAEIHAWGKSIEGKSTLLRIEFTPYFFVKTPGWSEARQRLYIVDASKKYNALAASSVPLKRVPLLGFTNNTPAQFIQLAFPTIESFRKAKYGIAREKLATFEATLDPLLRFYHVRNIQPAHWICATHTTRIHPEDPSRISMDTVDEYVTSFKHVGPDTTVTHVPPLVVASWDIECISGSGMFPDSSKTEDKIITIGTAFQRYGETEPYLRSAITLDTCDSIQGVDVVACASEADLINEWLALLREQHVDIMIGYNTSGFDYKYLDGRNSLLVDEMGEPEVRLELLGKSILRGGQSVEKNLSSAAYGDNKYFYLTSPGVMTLDLLQIFRKELKLESYSLNNVSKKYLEDGEEKIDLKPWEIFQKFAQGPAERAEIATYCVRDVELPLKLMRRLSTLENTMQMANAVCCPIDYLQNRGQQIRVYSQLIRKARSLGFVCPDVDRNAQEAPSEKYEGATVLNAERGAYFDIISALDFASLYPSIIMAHNMCPSTLVVDPKYANVEGVEYYEIETGAGVARFAQGVKCVVPELLRELALFRKQAKKDMASATDPFQKAVFNAKQLSYKVSSNSVYGFFGATRGMLPLVIMAAAVTATGRNMIEHSKKMAEELVPGTKVIYGDSVAGYTPLLVRRHGIVQFMAIEELARSRWVSMPSGKEYVELDGVETYTEHGWTRVDRVIRHRLSSGKQMVRVMTRAGLVDVTSDHSLLLEDGVPVRPCDVTIGSTSLLHYGRYPLPGESTDNDDNDDTVHLTTLEAVHAGFMMKYETRLDVPMFILNAPVEVRRAFFKGFLHACDGTIVVRPQDQACAARIYALAESLQYSVSFSSEHVDDACAIRMTVSTRVHPPNRNTVQAMHAIPSDHIDYVYDLTTANHHFAAGIGTLVVHNTDSIMCKFHVEDGKEHDMHEHFRVAQWVADEITKTFQQPIELEFEKTYWPYLLFSKKRYAGLMYTKADAPDYIDVKGLQLVRRDNAPIVKDISTKILDTIMYERSPQKAISLARESILDVLLHKEPMEKFVISKALRSGYKNPGSLPHVTVAQKLKKRRGYPPALGERVPYVFIRDPLNPDGLVAQRAEDPEYVTEHPEIELDTLYYVNNQIISPITTLLEVLMDSPDRVHEEILGHPDIWPLVCDLQSQKNKDIKVAKRVRLNTVNRQIEITRFFAPSK